MRQTEASVVKFANCPICNTNVKNQQKFIDVYVTTYECGTITSIDSDRPTEVYYHRSCDKNKFCSFCGSILVNGECQKCL